VAELRKIIPDGEPRTRMLQGLASVKTKLKKPDQDGGNASERAAEVILRMLTPAIAEPNLSQAPELWG
ncbi:MAG TPA: hypothetical protein VF953_08505, partial [Terriglobales bacterium]